MNQIVTNTNKKKTELLVEKIYSLSYGSIITHQEIENIIEENRKLSSNKYYHIVGEAKKILLEKYGRCIESIHKDGYRVINPDGYVDQGLKKVYRGFSMADKGVRLIKKAPVKDMSVEGREVYQRVNDRLTILQASMNGARAELRTLGKKEHPFNPENVGRSLAK